jgi:hypothetical protein
MSMKRWRLTWGEVSFVGDDLTAEDLALVDGLCGAGWDAGNPLKGPRIAANLLAVVVARHRGVTPDVVGAEIAAAPAETLMTALTVEDEPPPAPVAAAPAGPPPVDPENVLAGLQEAIDRAKALTAA